MIVKLLDASGTGFTILANARSCRFTREGGNPRALIGFGDAEPVPYDLSGAAFILNDAGDTIDSFNQGRQAGT